MMPEADGDDEVGDTTESTEPETPDPQVGRGAPKDRTLDGTTQQLKDMQKAQNETSGPGYRIDITKSKGSNDIVLRGMKGKSLKEIEE